MVTWHQLLIGALLIAGIVVLAYGLLASFAAMMSDAPVASDETQGCRTGAVGVLLIILAVIVAVGGLF